jgi:hypothetical protein
MLRVRGEENFETLASMGNLAMIYGYEDKFADSAALYGKVVDGLRRVKGGEHLLTLKFMEGLARDFDQMGKYAEADALYAKVWKPRAGCWGRSIPILWSGSRIWRRHTGAGACTRRPRLLVTLLEGRRHTLGGGHPGTLASIGDLGWLYMTEGRCREAEPLLREAADQFAKAASDGWERYRVECALGMSLAARNSMGRPSRC